MPANHPKKNRRSSVPSRVTPKGTRPPGVGRASLSEAVAVDHHLDTAPPPRMGGRSTPPNALRQRSGHRGGR
jgi:hypothetical protein